MSGMTNSALVRDKSAVNNITPPSAKTLNNDEAVINAGRALK